MPAMHYRLRWPDATETLCYSPSLVVQDYLTPGQHYALPDLMSRLRAATGIASERVRAKYGFACSRAADQLAELEQCAARYPAVQARVLVVAFEAA